MRLKTLGELRLEDSSFQRSTPLLFLTYLSLEGYQSRRHLADLFWPQQADKARRLNSLSRLLSDLRKHAPGTFEADAASVRPAVNVDLLEFRGALAAGDYARAERLYRGAFLAGQPLNVGAELEEWVYTQRETVTQQVQQLYLCLARRATRESRFTDAAKRAQQAYGLTENTEPEVLETIYPLLTRVEHPLASSVRSEAAEYDLALEPSAEIVLDVPKRNADVSVPDVSTAQDAPLPAAVKGWFTLSWIMVHVVGFVLVSLFAHETPSAFSVGGVAFTTAAALTVLLASSWDLLRRHGRVNWRGVGVATLGAVVLTLLVVGAENPSIDWTFSAGLATTVGLGATMGAARGWKAGLIGVVLALTGALTAELMSAPLTTRPQPMTNTTYTTSLVSCGVGAALWGYALAHIVLVTLRGR